MAGLQGKTFGDYQLTEQIGTGTIAEVYRARPRAGGREVAVKIIHPEFAQQSYFAPNFARIREMSQRLANHPHILPLLASDFQNGYAYLVTPLVEAGTLRDWLRSGGRLSESDAGPFYRQLCQALAYAHSLGAVHGNLKPSNVFLYEGRHVLLGDFGLLWDIRMLEMDVGGSGVEAMAYFAPEAYERQVTQASDVYSLGAVLFASITGQPPFAPTSLLALREAHQRKAPPRMVDVIPTLHPPLPELDPIVQRAMAKRPEQRFASAMQITQAVEHALRMGARDVVGVAPGPYLPQAMPLPGTPAQPAFGGTPGGAPFSAPFAMPGVPMPGGMPPMAGVAAPFAPPPGANMPVPNMPVPNQPGMPNMGPASVGAWPARVSALAPANPPFPPLPQSQRADPQMEVGHALGFPSPPAPQGPPFAPGQGAPGQFPPNMAPPSLPRQGPQYEEFLTARMPARSGWAPGMPGANPNAPGGPIAPTSSANGFSPAQPGPASLTGAADEAMSMIDWEEERPALPFSAAQRPDTPFSATKLGLPRLTASALGSSSASGASAGPNPNYVRAAAGYTSTQVPAVGDDSAYDPAYSAEYSAEMYTAEREADRRGRSRWDETGEDERYTRSDVRGDASYPSETEERQAERRERGRRRGQGRGRDTRDDAYDSYEAYAARDPYADSREDSAYADRRRGRRRRDERGDGRYDDEYESRSGRRGGRRRDAQRYDTYGHDAYGKYDPASQEHSAAPANGYLPDGGYAPEYGYPDESAMSLAAVAGRRTKVLRVAGIMATLVVLVLVGAASALYVRPSLCSASVCVRVATLEQRIHPNGAPADGAPATTVDIKVAVGATATTNLIIRNPDTQTQTWKVTSKLTWVTITPETGHLDAGATQNLAITAAPTSVTPGTYTDDLTLQTGTQNRHIVVKMTVTPGAKLAFAPQSLSYSTCGTAQTMTVTNSGIIDLTYTATPSDPALTLSPTKATLAAGKSGTVTATLACSAVKGTKYSIDLKTNAGTATIPVQYP